MGHHLQKTIRGSHIHLSLSINSEPDNPTRYANLVGPICLIHNATLFESETAQIAATEVGIEVRAHNLRDRLTPVNDSTGDGARPCIPMTDFDHGEGQTGGVASRGRSETVQTLGYRPAIIYVCDEVCDRYFLKRPLAHVGDIDEVVVDPETPWVAKSPGE
jgi:hypothetical protein